MTSAMHPISVIIITHNEEENISPCLESVAWADDLVVVDAQSRDRTAELARKYTSSVYTVAWAGFSETKQFAVDKARNDWILWLDADERVTPELAVEIQAVICGEGKPVVAYEIARKAFFLGKWIKHSGWYPGYVKRLFRKQSARFSSMRVHEQLEINGEVGRLKSHLIHYTDRTLYHYFLKFNSYTTLAAMDMDQTGKKASIIDLILRPPFMFFKMFLLRRGFLDGMHGLVLSLLSASYVFAKYAKLWELHSKRETTARS